MASTKAPFGALFFARLFKAEAAPGRGLWLDGEVPRLRALIVLRP
jgi:hypothetical protein